MKIVYVTNSGGNSGASVALWNIIESVQNQCSVFVLFPQEGDFSRKLEASGIPCYYVDYRMSLYPKTEKLGDWVKFPYRLINMMFQNYVAYKKVLNIIEAINPDLIHTNVGPADMGYKVAKQLNIRHVWHMREYQNLDFDMHYFPSKKKFKRQLKWPHNYCISITHDIFRHWDLDKRKDQVLYDGVIPNKAHQFIENKEKYFLFVGRIEKAKGVKLMIDAFKQFASIDSDFTLLVAGIGHKDYIKECMSIVDKAGLNNRVLFLGYRTDVYQLMEKAAALIVPSLNEGFGFITAEAMYNHCVVIGRDTAGTKEQFDIGLEQIGQVIGFRFSDVDGLYNQMRQVCQLSEDTLKRITHNAYTTVLRNYSIEKQGEKVLLFYKKIVGK